MPGYLLTVYRQNEVFALPENTALHECLSRVPHPLRGVLLVFPQESVTIILYHSVLPFLTCSISRVARCYSSFNLTLTLRAIQSR